MGLTLADIKTLIRAGLTREHLPEPPPEGPPASPGRSIWFRLFAAEPLPELPPATPRKGIDWRAMVAPERLPEAPPTEPRPRARHPWLTWLFVPEKLDPPGDAGPGSPR